MLRFNQHLLNQKWVVLVLFLAVFLLAGCAPDIDGKNANPVVNVFAGNSNNSQKCNDPKAQIFSGEFYPELQNDDSKAVVEKIYALAQQDTANLPLAKREALKFLRYETRRWSDTQYIELEGLPRMRVITTFISPGLVRALVLNQLLYKYDYSQPANLESATTESLAKLAIRSEFPFIMIVQPDNAAAPKLFSISPSEIWLHNTSGVQVKSTHSDDFLNSALSTSAKKYYSGFIFYPVATMVGGVCAPVLKPGQETSLMLRIEKAIIADKNTVLTWQIYFPLFANLNKPLYTVDTDKTTMNSEDAFEKPLAAPPDWNFDKNPDAIDWRDVGRFIWWKLTLEYIPGQ